MVTVPTQTASLVALPSFFRFLTKRARESGGRLILTIENKFPTRVHRQISTYLLMKSLLRMILLNLASVLLARNLKENS